MAKLKQTVQMIVCAATTLFAMAAHSADAWENGFDLRLGYMQPDITSTIELSGANGKGKLDLGNLFELDDATDSGRLVFAWRFKDKHELNLDLYAVRREGSSSAANDFSFTTADGDFVEVSAGASMETELKFNIYDINYGYSLIKNDRHHLKLTGGLYWMDINFELSGSADGTISVNGDPIDLGENEFRNKSEVSAPMPLLGLSYSFAITPRWLVDLDARYFAVTIDPYDGSIAYFGASTHYEFDWFYAGAGYTFVDLDIDVDNSDWKGSLESQIDGPSLFIGARF
jgi:hypothetical protein